MNDQNDEELNDDSTDEYAEPEPWSDPVEYAFAKASDAAYVKAYPLDFVTAVQQFRALEAEYLPLVSEDRGFNTLELRRRIAEKILDAAHSKKVTFEDCTNAWNNLLEVGFTHFARECTMRWFFADCCRKHKQPEIGLATLEPAIAELERLRAEPAATKKDITYYNHEIGPLLKLRAKLEAQRE